MAKGRPIRTFDYVNHPYDSVRDALRDDALDVFRSATHAAASRAHEVAVGLHVNPRRLDRDGKCGELVTSRRPRA